MIAGNGLTMSMSRTIKAPAARVYGAWTEAALLEQWLAPPPCVSRGAAADARVGGRYRIAVEEPGVGVHVTFGEYRELILARRVVMTWIYDGPHEQFRNHETLVRVELRAVSPMETELMLSHERLPDEHYRDSVHGGWTECLARLDATSTTGASL